MAMVSSRFAPVVVLMLAVFVGPSVIGFYTDWLWFGEVGYQHVFSTMLRGQASLFVATFLTAFVWFALNVLIALRTVRVGRLVFTTRDGAEVRLPGQQQLRTLVLGIALILAVLIGLYARAMNRLERELGLDDGDGHG